MQVDIWHNILWSRYKGVVFSETAKLAKAQGVRITFFQIAKTEGQREGLSEIDLAYHTYPYELIFDDSYDAIPKLRLYWELARRVWNSRADLIVLAGIDRSEYWAQLVMCLVKNKKVGVFCDSTIFDRAQTPIKTFLKRFFFARCDIVFCYGTRASEYVQSLGVPTARIKHRVQAAALPLDYSSSSALKDRLAHVSNTPRPRYLYVGRLSEEKQIYILLEAFDRVFRQRTDAQLTIVGTGPQKADLEKFARSLVSREGIAFVGAKSGGAIYDEYKRATCLILPSRSEPWGLVVNEALSYGCPVLVSDRCGCVPELVLNGETGFVVESGSVSDLVDKMEKILDPAYRTSEFINGCIAHMSRYSPAKRRTSLWMAAWQSHRNRIIRNKCELRKL